MTTTVEVLGVRSAEAFATVHVFDGIDVDTGDQIVFAVDHRPARDLREALSDPEVEVYAELEGWQILSREREFDHEQEREYNDSIEAEVSEELDSIGGHASWAENENERSRRDWE